MELKDKLLRHIVFWPGFLSDLFAQTIFLPSIWFIVTLPGFFRAGSLDIISETAGLLQFSIAIVLWFVSCGKLLSVFGYFFNKSGWMKSYSVLQLMYLALGMSMIKLIGNTTSDWLSALTLLWLAHALLAIYVAFRVKR